MPLLYLPGPERLFRWGADADAGPLASLGAAREAAVVTPQGVEVVEGHAVGLLEAAPRLAALRADALEAVPPSVAGWALATKLALELAGRGRLVPTLRRRGERWEARWGAALSAADDAARVRAIAAALPPSAHAVPVEGHGGRAPRLWAPDALLRAFLDALLDALVRARGDGPRAGGGERPRVGGAPPEPTAWPARWRAALTGADPSFDVHGFAERGVPEAIERWAEPALGARDRLRPCVRLELPEPERDTFTLRFLLQSPDDPSLLVAAADVWKARGRSLERLGRAFRDPQESLLEALGRAARLVPALAPALEEACPEHVRLDPAQAWEFLSEGASRLADAGFGVVVPAELTPAGERRLRLRMRVGGGTKVAGAVAGAARLSFEELLHVEWEAVLGDQVVGAADLARLARQKAPLVRYRGLWVAVDPAELGRIQARLARGATRLRARDAVRGALAGVLDEGAAPVPVVADGALADALARLRAAATTSTREPRTLRATLRPYQRRGLHWLDTMASLGLGACLADDMGLGKTMQLLAFLLARREKAPDDPRPALLVAPTSVVGNWEREAARFAPSLTLVPHYGGERRRTAADVPTGPGTLVLTTYGLLRRDAALLAEVAWSVVALDEAQHVKNAASATAAAARALRADHRVALTGTPVENRLAELWSILEFTNPGLLGPLETFRRELAVPIERFGSDAAAERLRRIVGPFLLRRLKSDPAIVKDLPPKHEMKVVCTLTREQASLYKAVVDEELRRIAEADGIARRGRVIALLMFAKQVCNHPAQYLGERGPLPGRSGKLARLTEMLEEALAAGDKALVFTQYREMGDLLVAHLGPALDAEILFLHGGVAKKARDALVRRFQDEPRGPRVLVLSVKAGGTGLNLTAANHVFHYDRWWNPAVEDQATDRAYRIGQRRAVQVHKLVCAGTVEEKIDAMLEHKRALASKVVASGERWITELPTDELRELFALSERAVPDADLPDDEATERPRPARRPRTGRTRGRAR